MREEKQLACAMSRGMNISGSIPVNFDVTARGRQRRTLSVPGSLVGFHTPLESGRDLGIEVVRARMAGR